jgi:hypothetical protein
MIDYKKYASNQAAAQQQPQMKGYSSRLGQGRLKQNTAIQKGGLLAQAANAVSGRVNPSKPAPKAPVGHDPNRTQQYLARIQGRMNAPKPQVSNKGPYADTMKAYARNYSQEQGAVKKLYASPAAPNRNTRDQRQGLNSIWGKIYGK